MREKKVFLINAEWKEKSLLWAQSQDYCTYFNPNQYVYPEDSFRHILAAGALETFSPAEGVFNKLKEKLKKDPDWWIGYFSYDLKNEIEKLESRLPDKVRFPEAVFFKPKTLIHFSDEEEAVIESVRPPQEIFEEISRTEFPRKPGSAPSSLLIKNMITKTDYLSKIKKLQEHIVEGDIYEINFCQEFYGENLSLDPLKLYQKLNTKSPTPFSVYAKFKHHFLCSASPERFLKKDGERLYSQPIKGTIRRGKNREEDNALKEVLFYDPKERAENLMIVDLVRNDLAKSAEAGSVQVSELFGIYSFPQVHQMTSTVTAKLRQDVHPVDAIRNAFPMGSMTGAPKIRAMELSEKYEESKRGLYSGAIGYFTPESDFDFSVVIRSLLYNEENRTLSYQVGSAITIDSQPENEYNECLLKAKAIKETLNDFS
ncbi:MAG: aminodeoxychorismate synthase component I [Cytophagales bacterium]|nr:aminodeoxychorismate synthase component I [Cytophagales bacterium]